MDADHSEDAIRRAMEECAAEPVHIPGRVQPFGCVISADAKSGTIQYASKNCADIIGFDVPDLLNASLRDVFGPDLVHALRNVAAQPDFDSASVALGAFEINGLNVESHAFSSGDQHVLEFEAESAVALASDQALDVLSMLIDTVHKCGTQDELFAATADVMRHLSGYDRVMIYKFDADFNGEVVAEVKRASMEPFLGLRFPSYDIPAQARALMAKLPLRFIEDCELEPVPLIAAGDALPELDITYAASRGVSPVHMVYLKNMGTQATMTLSIVIGGKLWGMISFHHSRRKIPPARLRPVLTKFTLIFSAKLETLQQNRLLHQINNVDQIKNKLLLEIENDEDMSSYFPAIAPTLTKVLRANGASIIFGSQSRGFGQVPGQSVLREMLGLCHSNPDGMFSTKNLAKQFPHLATDLNGVAGAFAFAIKPERAICFFREETETKITWAGNPDKEIETVSGTARLKPRGSFMTYLEQVSGESDPWTDQDLFFLQRIWAIVDSAERRALLNVLNRQQTLMINELNHRVRNILTLVRSVSQQAQRRYGSLNSYSKSLEARIQALAAVHDISSGSNVLSIEIQTLIRAEFRPYEAEDAGQVSLTGENPRIHADVAPIFSLVIHELTTNAAKYGALSVDTGSVSVLVERHPNGFNITWKEAGGPTVSEPDERGFGSTLIQQAIPYELKGKSELVFAPSGVEATLFVPDELFDQDAGRVQRLDDQGSPHPMLSVSEKAGIPVSALKGTALVLEDNFIIAREMGDQLVDFGFEDVVKFATVAEVLDFVEGEEPAVAILDMNLGNGQTSEAAALRLQEMKVAFVFVTGYGDNAELPKALKSIPTLTKPIEPQELRNALTIQLSKQ